MAVNVDTVYQRVLAIANKEQRGYITPQEFNLLANQAQMEIFEQYFYDLDQFRAKPGNDTTYSDMIDLLEEKIDIFEVKEGKKYIPRVFLQNYPDVEMGMVLIKEEINKKNYEQALIYVDHILSMDNPPKYAYYWKAEVLYRMNEYIDSWFAFMIYLEKANIPQFPNNQ